jgi:hypothetical protein
MIFLALLLHQKVLTTFEKLNKLFSVCNNHHLDAQLYYDIYMLAYLPEIPEVLPGGVCDSHEVSGSIERISQNHLLIVDHHWTVY